LPQIAPFAKAEIRFIRTDSKDAIRRASAGEAALIIGDEAFSARKKFKYTLDLAEEWWKATGLPFVFGVWAVRKDSISRLQMQELLERLEEGVEESRIYTRQWADEHGWEREDAERYIESCIDYRTDDTALESIRSLVQQAAKRRLLANVELDTQQRKTFSVKTPAVDVILDRAALGERISVEEGLVLAANASLADMSLAADERRALFHQDDSVSYIVDRNINYTNVCNVYCRFCAFYEAPGKAGGYLLSKEEIGEKIEEMMAGGGRQILLQGGLNPELGIEYYEDLFRWIKARYAINLHALSSDEIWHISRVSDISIEETLARLVEAGLGSLPGGGGEILVDRVRHRIARLKTSSEEWLEVHRVAHTLGLTSTCTMMFGVQENWLDRLSHLNKLRKLQDETGGFTAFIAWPFQEDNTKLKKSDTSAPEYLRVQALARLFLDNIPGIQSSWVTMGPSIGQVALLFGANDFGSVMFEENVVSAAGTTFCMNAAAIERHIRDVGFEPWQRDVHYQRV